MQRAIWALMGSCVLVSACFGSSGILLLIVTIPLTLFAVYPLFWLFAWRRWLLWWQIVSMGLLIAAAYIAYEIVRMPAPTLDIFLPEHILLYLAIVIGFTVSFWWLGVYRNPAFPSVPAAIPWRMAVLIPVLAAGLGLHQLFRLDSLTGRLIAVGGTVSAPEFKIRLTSGKVIDAIREEGVTRPPPSAGQCMGLLGVWSMKRFHRVYEVGNTVYVDTACD